MDTGGHSQSGAEEHSSRLPTPPWSPPELDALIAKELGK